MPIPASNSDSKSDPDRYLALRGGGYQYKRRVPAMVRARDARYPIIRIGLGTRDLLQARAKRDAYERADHEYWASLTGDGDRDVAMARYTAAVERAKALGFTYRHLTSILAEESGAAILERLEALQKAKPGSPEASAILGGVARPRVSLSDAFDIYVEKIAASELTAKSAEQRKRWRNVKKAAVTAFEGVCGPKNIEEITRDDALRFYNWWLERIAPGPGKKATHNANTGNKQIGNMKILYARYFTHLGEPDRRNPFRDLRFAEKKKGKRPPFPTDWIVDVLLATSSLRGLNREARAILYVMIETGARPSEIANLPAECIRLNHNIPHIKVQPRDDTDDPRELKTTNSEREIPLVGVALEAMRHYPQGFPTYRDKSDNLSATVNKYLTENALLPTEKHTLYSLRHSFEDRAKDAKVDAEMRTILMGHAPDRPEYGSGGSLQWKLDGLLTMALPFDREIV